MVLVGVAVYIGSFAVVGTLDKANSVVGMVVVVAAWFVVGLRKGRKRLILVRPAWTRRSWNSPQGRQALRASRRVARQRRALTHPGT